MHDAIHYRSTRGLAPELDFADAVLTGLASDGGLYVPTRLPHFAPEGLEALAGAPYKALARQWMLPFVEEILSEAELAAMLEEAYGSFRHQAVTPLVQIGPNEWVLELFHGPTLAFKDVAMQFLGRLLDRLIAQRGLEKVVVLGATSGDTGSAAIEGLRHVQGADIVILHPKGRVSEVQRRQMTTVDDARVHNLAVDGHFDDCQRIVKELFADGEFRRSHPLVAVNSINWARILAQMVYYVYAGLILGAAQGRGCAFAVPTGNFGDVLAGHYARQMGLPVAQLIIGTNRNDILTRFMETGRYALDRVSATMSPSIDIQISSNFERYLYALLGEDGEAMRGKMEDFRERGALEMERGLAQAQKDFSAARVSEEDTLATIRDVYRESGGYVIDPHTAVGLCAGRACWRDPAHTPLVALATAHPAKFPDAVERATGIRPPLPEHLADLMERRERMTEIAADTAAVQSYIEGL